MKGKQYTVNNGHPELRIDGKQTFTQWYDCRCENYKFQLPFVPYVGLIITDGFASIEVDECKWQVRQNRFYLTSKEEE